MNLKEKNILITGGLGFVGSNLAVKLHEMGNNVVITYRNPKRKYRLKPYENDIESHKIDIRDYNKLNSLIKKADIIFHLAAQTSHPESMKDSFYDTDVNVIGMLNVLESIRKDNKDAILVFTSTKGVVGIPEELPVTEETPLKPLDVYSANKILCENYCRIFSHHYGIKYSILRLTNVFGERQQITSPRIGILNFFIGRAMKNEIITIYGDGEQKRDYNYITNVIDALILCATNENALGNTYFLGTNRGIKFKEMANKIVKMVGKGEVKHIPYPETAKKIEIGDFIVNYNKIKRDLGWEPKITFEDGLQKTINYYQEHSEYFDD